MWYVHISVSIVYSGLLCKVLLSVFFGVLHRQCEKFVAKQWGPLGSEVQWPLLKLDGPDFLNTNKHTLFSNNLFF